MIKNFRTIAMAASVAALCFLASCVKKDPASAPDPDPVPGVELVNESDKEISVTAVALEDYEVLINFVDGLNRDDIAVNVPEGIDWCSASLSAGKDAVILNVQDNMEEDVQTTVSIVNKEDATIVYLSINVKSIAGYLKVTSVPAYEEDYMKKMTVTAEETPITFTVETNLEKWYVFSYDMMAYGAADWIEFNQTSGRDGETCTVTVRANTGSDRMAYICFDVEEPGEYAMMSDYFTLFLTQGPGQGSGNPEDFKIYYWGPTGEQVYLEGNSYDLQFAANDEGYPGLKDFYVEPEGASYYPVFCIPGTTEKDMSIEGAENPWIMIANWGLIIVPTKNTTGASRSTDLVLFTDSTCTTELFRFKITQDGTVAEM